MNIPNELAKAIVKDLFELGGEFGNPVQRIQFMSGEIPRNEVGLGGMGDVALIRFIEKSSHNHSLRKPTTF